MLQNSDKKKELFLNNFEETFGNIFQTCKITDISRPTFYRWVNEDKDFREKIESYDSETLKFEFVENKLMSAINKGNITAIIFYLKCKGKEHGYIEKSEITNKNYSEIEIRELENFKKYKEMSTEELKDMEIKMSLEIVQKLGIDLTEEQKEKIKTKLTSLKDIKMI